LNACTFQIANREVGRKFLLYILALIKPPKNSSWRAPIDAVWRCGLQWLEPADFYENLQRQPTTLWSLLSSGRQAGYLMRITSKSTTIKGIQFNPRKA
jgi:hypothetical protein